MGAIRVLINNSVKKKFIEKKKVIDVLTIFSFLMKIMSKFYKNDAH